MVTNTLCLTFNGLSKTYRLAGFRSGWMLISGRKDNAASYIEGLEMLASMRLCANALALAARMWMRGEWRGTGVTLPISPALYTPLLKGLATEGISFTENDTAL